MNVPEFELSEDRMDSIPFKVDMLNTYSGYNPTKPHRHNFYELFFFENGGGIHMVDFKENEIETRDIHIVLPGQIHYMNREQQSKGIVIKFSPDFTMPKTMDGDFLHRVPLLDNISSSLVLKPSVAEFETQLMLVESMRVECNKKSSSFQDMIRHYLHLLLIRCNRILGSSNFVEISTEYQIDKSFKLALDQNFNRATKVSFYVRELGVSADKLNSVLKTINGLTASEMIAKRILLEAKRQLLYSSMSVKEIAFGLNFQDNAYFNRWFKKMENCSPGQFRVDNRAKYGAIS